jgi:hypothetical protein
MRCETMWELDWSITYAVNVFLWHHDSLEDPLLA